MNTDLFTLERRCYKPNGQKQERCGTGLKHFCSGSQKAAEVISVRVWPCAGPWETITFGSGQCAFPVPWREAFFIEASRALWKSTVPWAACVLSDCFVSSPSLGRSFHCSENWPLLLTSSFHCFPLEADVSKSVLASSVKPKLEDIVILRDLRKLELSED